MKTNYEDYSILSPYEYEKIAKAYFSREQNICNNKIFSQNIIHIIENCSCCLCGITLKNQTTSEKYYLQKIAIKFEKLKKQIKNTLNISFTARKNEMNNTNFYCHTSNKHINLIIKKTSIDNLCQLLAILNNTDNSKHLKNEIIELIKIWNSINY